MAAPTIRTTRRRWAVLQETTTDTPTQAAGITLTIPAGSIVIVEYNISGQHATTKTDYVLLRGSSRFYVNNSGGLSNNFRDSDGPVVGNAFAATIVPNYDGVILTGVDAVTVDWDGWFEVTVLAWPNTFTAGA